MALSGIIYGAIDDDVSRLEQRIDEHAVQIAELSVISKQADDRLNNITDRLINITDKLESTMAALSVVQDKLDIPIEDRISKPFDKNKIYQVAILRSNTVDNMYYLTYGQKANIDRAVRLRLCTHKLIEVINNVPYSIHLFDHVKKQLGSKAKAINRSIQLHSIDEATFIDEIKALFNGRRNVDLSKKP